MACFHYLFLALLIILCGSTAESAVLQWEYCNDKSPINSPQQSRNIDALLAVLVSDTILNGFITTSVGESPDLVYGLAQCRVDVGQVDCAVCIQEAAKQIRQLCPNQADARIWFDFCFLRYDNERFSGQVDTSFGRFIFNPINVPDPASFNTRLQNLTDRIRSEAVVPGNVGLGKGKTELSDFVDLYALVQCTQDLPPDSCSQCLAAASNRFFGYCRGRIGCRILYSSCTARYELYPFYFPVDAGLTMGNFNSILYESE